MTLHSSKAKIPIPQKSDKHSPHVLIYSESHPFPAPLPLPPCQTTDSAEVASLPLDERWLLPSEFGVLNLDETSLQLNQCIQINHFGHYTRLLNHIVLAINENHSITFTVLRINHTSPSSCAPKVCSLFEGRDHGSLLLEILRATFAFGLKKTVSIQYLHFNKFQNIFIFSPHSFHLKLFPPSKLQWKY